MNDSYPICVKCNKPVEENKKQYDIFEIAFYKWCISIIYKIQKESLKITSTPTKNDVRLKAGRPPIYRLYKQYVQVAKNG